MRKIIFSNIALRKQMDKQIYPVDGNSRIQTDIAVYFPVNSVLPKLLKKGDSVKVVLSAKDDLEKNCQANVELFKQELNEINKDIGAEVEYVILNTPYEETRFTHEKQLRAMIGQLEEGAEIIADVTYGPKPLPIIMFQVLNFAEKFFGCDINNIIYGKVDFLTKENGVTTPVNPIIYDLTPLYFLNNLTNKMDCNSVEEAIKSLDLLLDM